MSNNIFIFIHILIHSTNIIEHLLFADTGTTLVKCQRINQSHIHFDDRVMKKNSDRLNVGCERNKSQEWLQHVFLCKIILWTYKNIQRTWVKKNYYKSNIMRILMQNHPPKATRTKRLGHQMILIGKKKR